MADMEMTTRDESPDKVKWQELSDSGRLERHSCYGDQPHWKHVVVRDVTKEEFSAVAKALTYTLGRKPYWNTKPASSAGSTVYDMEAVYQADGRVSRPWKWCGTSVLFADWQEREERVQREARTFKAGDEVWFTTKSGALKTGLVVKANEKTVSVLVAGEGQWRVSPGLLTRKGRGSTDADLSRDMFGED